MPVPYCYLLCVLAYISVHCISKVAYKAVYIMHLSVTAWKQDGAEKMLSRQPYSFILYLMDLRHKMLKRISKRYPTEMTVGHGNALTDIH